MAVFTALSWFGRKNDQYVREIWDSLGSDNVWNRKNLRRPYYRKNGYIMYPLVQPSDLRKFLLERVVEQKIIWDDLYTKTGDILNEQYRTILEKEIEDEEMQGLINDIWSSFIGNLIHNRSLLLFAQRDYINENFSDFNQLETLEDTNAPWDWDHIYPQSWVSGKWYVDKNVRHWTYTIGNIRAISLKDNRSENNRESPSERLKSVKTESFIKDNDWEYWSKTTDRIYEDQHKEIKIYLSAVINRLCNVYEEWYNNLTIGDMFN